MRRLLAQRGRGSLGGELGRLLRRELRRTYVRLWLRVVDERGVVRASVEGARMPIGLTARASTTCGPAYEWRAATSWRDRGSRSEGAATTGTSLAPAQIQALTRTFRGVPSWRSRGVPGWLPRERTIPEIE